MEWAVIFFSRGSSRHRDQTLVSCLAGRFFTTEPPGKPVDTKNFTEWVKICVKCSYHKRKKKKKKQKGQKKTAGDE